MRAVRPHADGVVVADVDEPEGPGRVLEVVSSGICGTDLHLVGPAAVGLGLGPVTLGHEFAGRLDDGTLVAVDPSGPCGTCDQCRSGASHRCRTGATRAQGVAVDGGMADRVLVRDDAVVPLPEGLDVADACLVEPVGVAVHGLRVADARGGTVAVVGGGSIGLAAVAAAADVGADVGIVARHPHQQVAGERLGGRVVDRGEYDVVVEAAGTEDALATAAQLCRPGGTVLFLSTHWTPVAIPGIVAAMKELRFAWGYTYGTHAGGRDVDDAADLLARTPTIAETLVTHRFPLEEAPEAFRVAADRQAGAIKVVLEP